MSNTITITIDRATAEHIIEKMHADAMYWNHLSESLLAGDYTETSEPVVICAVNSLKSSKVVQSIADALCAVESEE